MTTHRDKALAALEKVEERLQALMATIDTETCDDNGVSRPWARAAAFRKVAGLLVGTNALAYRMLEEVKDARHSITTN